VKPDNAGMEFARYGGQMACETSMSPLLRSISSSNCKITDIGEDAWGSSPS